MMGTAMAKGGRPRKQGHREPNGRLSREIRKIIDTAAEEAGKPPEGLSPAEVRRFLEVGVARFSMQRWGTPVGRLTLDGKLTPRQFAAANWWDKIATEYREATSAPAPDPKAMEMGRGQSGQEPDPDSSAGRAIAARRTGVKRKFQTCHRAVLEMGLLAEHTLRSCCEGRGRFPEGFEELSRLRDILEVVIPHMTIGSVDK